MNLPNKITTARVALVPFMVFFFMCEEIPYHHIWSLIVFLVASLTDILDGKIARTMNIVTDFGKFLDPIADKILVVSAMVCMIPDICHPLIVIVILFREFIVSSLRLVAASQNIVIAASKLGKLKTFSQMISISTILFLLGLRDLEMYQRNLVYVSNTLLGITAAIAIVSCIDYIYKNRRVVGYT
ncbi:MAG: CDP-diacylglycerol--glycerol-3-phosphate 3-phosphatidyltransferase [archaeon]|nr:CDP-diacylglycerol--glycerol-3-phosphate 3-phosphatidyltransferase [archaeon]